MSHELLRQAAQHLSSSENPQFQEGGRRLFRVADSMLRDGFLPQTDPAVDFIVHSESRGAELHVAADFEFDTKMGILFKDGQRVESLREMERKVFNRLLLTPGEIVSPKEAIRFINGYFDESGVLTLRTYISIIRSKLPVTDERARQIIQTFPKKGFQYNHFPRE